MSLKLNIAFLLTFELIALSNCSDLNTRTYFNPLNVTDDKLNLTRRVKNVKGGLAHCTVLCSNMEDDCEGFRWVPVARGLFEIRTSWPKGPIDATGVQYCFPYDSTIEHFYHYP